MAPEKCCVGGCSATSETHRLYCVPKNDNLRSLWMSFLVPTNPNLLGLSKEQLLRKRVCDQHFDRHQLDRHGRRLPLGYPCLFSAPEIAYKMPLGSDEYHVLSEHNYFQTLEDNDDGNMELLVLQRPGEEHSYTPHTSAQMSEELTTRPPDTKGEEHSYTPHTSAQMSEELTTRPPDTKADYQIPSCSYGEIQKCTSLKMSTPKEKVPSTMKKFASSKRKFIRHMKNMAAASLGKSALERLNEAQEIIQNENIMKNYESLGSQAKTFLTMQLRMVRKNKMARRFTMEEKLLALMFFKQSPKCYKLLEAMFALPTKRTLNRLSQNICFEPGFNSKVFKYVKEVVKTWDVKKKLCTITFDEIALTPHLTFNEYRDVIDGFVELGGERAQKFCDHALVFMIRGICSKWRQPIAYYFSEGTVSSAQLMNILKELVSHVSKTGLCPLGLVCDQGSTFRSALQQIRQNTIRSREEKGIRDYGTIEISGLELNVFFDPPHLIKSIRNNFLTKDMIFEGKTGSWKDIMFIYDIDSKLGNTRALPKLTSQHVIPEKIKKMKVSAATQVLSARTAAMLKYTNALNIKRHEENTMVTTAEIVEFFDALFDSVNGSAGSAVRGKLRGAVKINSTHIKFWEESIEKIKRIKFVDLNSKLAIQSGKRYVRAPCLEGWITTLESFIRLSKLLFTEYKIEYFYPRCVNQDPLENFFGRIRAMNYRNVNPDAHTFMHSFKALVLSNILSPHSRFANCEEDNGETLMDLNFLFENVEEEKENIPPSSISPSSSSQKSKLDLTDVITEKIRVQCSAYTAGYLCRQMYKFIKCGQCIKTYTTKEHSGIHKYIQFREYNRLKSNNLAYPNEKFLRLYRDASERIHDFLNKNCHIRNIRNEITNTLRQLSFSWLGCQRHIIVLQSKFLKLVIKLQVHNWVKIINNILKGSIQEKYVLKMGHPQKMAFKKFQTIRIKKKKILKIKNLNI